MTPPAQITAAVLAVFRLHCPRWQPPDAAACAMIGCLLEELQRRNRGGARARLERQSIKDELRRRIGALVGDREAVAALAEAARAGHRPDAGAALAALAEALGLVKAALPEVIASPAVMTSRRVPDEDIQTVLTFLVHNGLQAANSGRALGLARSAKAPVARAVAALVALAGVTVDPGTIGARIARGGYNVGRPHL